MSYDFYPDFLGASKGKASRDGSAEYNRGHRFVFDGSVVDVAFVGSLPEIFAAGVSYPTDPLALISDIAPMQHEEDPSVWDVIVTYARPKLSQQAQGSNNPLDMPVLCEWGSNRYERPFVRDANGFMFVNSAGDPYNPPAMVEYLYDTVTATYNLAEVPAWVRDLKGRTNSAQFSVEGQFVEQECARIMDVLISKPQFEKVNDAIIRYRTVTIPIEIRDPVLHKKVTYIDDGGTWTTATNRLVPGWWHSEQDAGFRKKSGGVLVKILDDNGAEISQPALLDGSGGKLSTPVTPGNEYYRVARKFTTADFSVLNLPTQP